MALTVEVLKANSVLAGLSDEQLAAITTLSANVCYRYCKEWH